MDGGSLRKNLRGQEVHAEKLPLACQQPCDNREWVSSSLRWAWEARRTPKYFLGQADIQKTQNCILKNWTRKGQKGDIRKIKSCTSLLSTRGGRQKQQSGLQGNMQVFIFRCHYVTHFYFIHRIHKGTRVFFFFIENKISTLKLAL